MDEPCFAELVEGLRAIPPEEFVRTADNEWKFRAFARWAAPTLPRMREVFAKRGLGHLVDEALDADGNLDPSRMLRLADQMMAAGCLHPQAVPGA